MAGDAGVPWRTSQLPEGLAQTLPLASARHVTEFPRPRQGSLSEGCPLGPTAPYQQVCQGSHTGRQGRGLVTQAFLSFHTGDTSVMVTGLLAGLAVLLRSRQCRALCLPPEQLWSPVAEGGHCHDPRQTLATGALLSGKSLVKQCP